MTLSRWLRDYLYIPLGGNRKGVARMYVALMSTMALGGLWHGADWRFVVWGIYHGVLLVIHRLWASVTAKHTGLSKLKGLLVYRVATIIVTFTFIAWGWILFRAQSFSDALSIFLGLFKYIPHGETSVEMQIACLALLALFLEHTLGQFQFVKRGYERLPAFARGITWAVMVVGVFFFSSSVSVFIYFQF
jgi:alginate O-acetyltransferase complex protein AlgI